jgi:hypothetical protein
MAQAAPKDDDRVIVPRRTATMNAKHLFDRFTSMAGAWRAAGYSAAI